MPPFSLDPSLAADLVNFFESWERGPLRFVWKSRRRGLLARLRSGTQASVTVPTDLIEATRARWADDYRVMMPDAPALRIDRDGLWLAGWLLAGEGLPGHDPISPDRMAAALATLPVMTREAFLLHRRERLAFDAIATRLGIAPRAARAAVADALLRLDEALSPD